MNKFETSFGNDTGEISDDSLVKPEALSELSTTLEADINPDEIFEKTRLELEEKEEIAELQSMESKWLEEEIPKVRKRLGLLGTSEKKIDEFIKIMEHDLISKTRVIGSELDSMKDDLAKIRPDLIKTEEVQSLADWLDQASRLSILKLLNRKFKGESSDWEKQILTLMNAVKHKGVGATHHPIFEEIDFFIFNEKGFEEWSHLLDHELTHQVLSSTVPKAAYIRAIAQKDLTKKEREFSAAVAFSGLLGAINESAAHLVEGRSPDIDSYADKINSRIFDRVYRLMKEAIKGKSPEDSDKFFIHFYDGVTKEWREDMTSEEIARLIINLDKFF